MTDTRELVMEIKRIIHDDELTRGEIKERMEQMGEIPPSDATFTRLLKENSEDNTRFSFDYTLAPLARALGIDSIDGNDTAEVKALKEMLRLKKNHISELEKQLDQEKIKRHEQIEEVREQSRRSIDFLREQISYKDARMNEFSSRVEKLLEMITKKDERIEQLTSDILALKDIKEKIDTCPYRKEKECKNED